MNIAGIEIGSGQPCRFVAEISNNHNGDYDTALELVTKAKWAGADFVKFQAYTPDELIQLRGEQAVPPAWVDQYPTTRELYTKAMTPRTWFAPLTKYCAELGIPWFASAFGLGSLAIMEALGCPAYKIASLDNQNRRLGWMIASLNKPIVRSTAGNRPKNRKILSLWCPPGYPQPSLALHNLEKHDGFSYHGKDPMALVTAAARGAQLVECHVQLDNRASELEANISLNMTQFQTAIQLTRSMEASL